MTIKQPLDFLTRSRFTPLLWIWAALLLALSLLRVVLLVQFGSGATHSLFETIAALAVGLFRDAAVAGLFMLPAVAFLAILPTRWLRNGITRLMLALAVVGFAGLQIFNLVVEYFFFEEFRSRFNTVAVDYVLYPHEVFINIWESYPVVPSILLCATLAVIFTAVVMRLSRGFQNCRLGFRQRLAALGVVTAATAAALAVLPWISNKVSRDRTLNEIANNGVAALATAAWTHHLDYAAYHRTMDMRQAYERVGGMLGVNPALQPPGVNPLQRHVSGDPTRPKLNVVLMLEESLGSEFFGCLGREEPTLTPHLDALSKEGLLFTHMYADGNRTVRGMEGVLASFPPLPGDSIVKRDRSENVETIARVLKRDGYETMFLYGGRGLFDSMRSFTTQNGYERFIEQKDFPNPTFSTVWGVCNEDLYTRTLEECRSMAASGKPFIATVLSVSNHKPFTYPEGRIYEDPKARQRAQAVKYTDWALGQFFDQAKKESFWNNTVFVVIADHGARVYGSQKIPIHSYEIPLMILGPAAVREPARIGSLGCQLDVAPTILGLIGRPYDSVFFGHDLLASAPEPARVVLHHNRDIGLMEEGRMVVMGLGGQMEYYVSDKPGQEMHPVASPDAALEKLAGDAIAVFQVADDLYMNLRYRIEGAPIATRIQ